MLTMILPNTMQVEASVQEWLSAMLMTMTPEHRSAVIERVHEIKMNKHDNLPIVTVRHS